MPQRAQVKSVEAIASFRTSLILFLAKTRAVLEEISDEKQRTRVWIQTDRRTHWENESRRRGRKLQEAQQELFTSKLSLVHTQTAAQVLAVERAKGALRAAEEKREVVKRWSREFENRAEPLAKQIDQLQTFLTTDLAKAVVYLGKLLDTLEAYAAIQSDMTAGHTIDSSKISEEAQDSPAASAPSTSALPSGAESTPV